MITWIIVAKKCNSQITPEVKSSFLESKSKSILCLNHSGVSGIPSGVQRVSAEVGVL